MVINKLKSLAAADQYIAVRHFDAPDALKEIHDAEKATDSPKRMSRAQRKAAGLI